jgi:uncharacterized protein YbaA (DUF1428 family)/uncharacterized glyoxalase superfamily protein PhnB
MSYIDGFVIAVPTANKQKFIDHAKLGDSVFMDLGAARILECWGDDVTTGKLTDFRRAVQAKDDETVVFSWIEWPDKQTRDAAHAKMVEWMKHPEKADPRMHPQKNPMPFDGKRLVFGGFVPIVGIPSTASSLIQPYVFFRGRCEEAIEYYQAKLGAEVSMLLRFSDNPDKPPRDKVPATLDQKIMHAEITVAGATLMLSDGMKSGSIDNQAVSLSLSVSSEAEADRIFNALAADGRIEMPMGPAFFAKRFGAVADKFGISWMIMVPTAA